MLLNFGGTYLIGYLCQTSYGNVFQEKHWMNKKYRNSARFPVPLVLAGIQAPQEL